MYLGQKGSFLINRSPRESAEYGRLSDEISVCSSIAAIGVELQKQLELWVSEEALVYHIFARLETQVQHYVEVRNPQNTVQLLEVLSKFEERYSCKTMRGSRNSDNVLRRGRNERRMSNADDSRRN
ncbi:uncharacterized protein TNCV_2693011 [Trichonephila clavipes]|uniref:Uncharacterized protein n=1 Tax=Trichonephila clavipes TaxID=2585209 RepID=A0A8X7BAJ6_TRICX|nr:uncharacterized protein TNCV_2693011 [Trichonephila clavipes]